MKMEQQVSEFGNVDFSNEESGDESPETISAHNPDDFLTSNAFRIVYQTNNFFLPQIQQMIKHEQTINLRPAYQRRLRWSEKKKSTLIESLLLNVPIPPIFLFESEAARYEVMDGQQRMSTIDQFLNDEHTLSGLEILGSLNGMSYSQCTPKVQRTLERASVSAIVLLLESDTAKSALREIANSEPRFSTLDIRRLVFNRINTGGTNLNPQEVRNALNPGPFNEMIIGLSRWSKFTDTFEIPPHDGNHPGYERGGNGRGTNALYRSMKDCEIVLRYFALKDEPNIRGSMRGMLDRAMEVARTEDEVDRARLEYMDIFSCLYALFDGRPFRLPSKGTKGYTISVPLYDGLMVAASRILSANPSFEFDPKRVSATLATAVDDNEAYEVIVARANTAEAVRKRIDLMVSVLSG